MDTWVNTLQPWKIVCLPSSAPFFRPLTRSCVRSGLALDPEQPCRPKFILFSSGLPVAIGRVQGLGIGHLDLWMIISAAYTSSHLHSPVYIPGWILVVWPTSSCLTGSRSSSKVVCNPFHQPTQCNPSTSTPYAGAHYLGKSQLRSGQWCQVTLVGAMWDISCRR